tara:strand:- start:414 stop:662 length:249 start_codon:yes stop_codon:yes gene_type:complete
MTDTDCTISHSLDVLDRTIDAIDDLYRLNASDEIPTAALGGITLLLAITDQYGPEYFTDEEVNFITEADQYLSETIKEFYPK